jgi:transposase
MSTPNAFAGIDVSKRSLDLALRVGNQVVSQRSFPNSQPGIEHLIDSITAKHRPVRAVLEPTSRFHVRLRDALANHAHCEVMAINPARAHYYLAAAGFRAKTDRIDARGLALLAQQLAERFIPFTTPSPVAQELQLLGRQLLALVQQRVQCRNRLSSLDQQLAIHARARASLELTIAMLKQQADALVAEMVELVQTDKLLRSGFARLIQIKGVGEQSAAQLLAELAVLPADMTARHWTANAGLDPRPFQSGQSNPPQRISRMGNKYLRHVLYVAAMSLSQHQSEVKAYYLFLQEQGKPKKLALTVIMRRFLHAIWVMLHREQPFLASKAFPIPLR